MTEDRVCDRDIYRMDIKINSLEINSLDSIFTFRLINL